jgi:hypothetical protein
VHCISVYIFKHQIVGPFEWKKRVSIWPPGSSDLTPLDFVSSFKVRNLVHLL